MFKNPKYYAYITENIPTEIENTIKELIDKKLIKELEIGSKTKYELTHLGFFELL